jgi:hypothetical protein
MDAETRQRMMDDLGLGSEEARFLAQMRAPALTIAMLTVLKRIGVLSDEDVDAIEALAEKVAQKLTTFSLSALKLGLARENLISISLEEAKTLARTVVEAGTWLLESSLCIDREKRVELEGMLAIVREALAEEGP